jgi:acetoacetate decarboxylase
MEVHELGENRWIRDMSATRPGGGGGGGFLPVLPSLEAVYLTDPDALAAVLPPPLEAPVEPRVHARITEIKLEFGDFKHHEMVGFFAVDAVYEGQPGEYPLLIPIDLESALSISREKFGEPKKLADIELERDGDHVEGRITRNGVTFIEMIGDVSEKLPTPAPYPNSQFWFKFLPAVEGDGFDAGPFLVKVDQIRTPESLERVEGKLVLRDLPSCPVVDLPVLETVSLVWTTRQSTHEPHLVGPVDAEAFKPYAWSRYETVG